MSPTELQTHDVCAQLLELLEHEADGLTFAELKRGVNKPRNQVETAIRTLDWRGAIYPDHTGDVDDGTRYRKTPSTVQGPPIDAEPGVIA